jgi:aryl-alcohol dehydrogenase-like predicted oxidoreductase
LQVLLNLFEMPTADSCLPLAAQRKIAIIAREPFSRGRLLPPDPSAESKLGFMGRDYDSRFESIARRLDRTVPQLALQFLLQTPGIACTLAGMSSPRHLQHNARVFELPPLSTADMNDIRAVALAPSG